MTSKVTLEFVSGDAKRVFIKETGVSGRELEIDDRVLLVDDFDGLREIIPDGARVAFAGMTTTSPTTQTLTPNSASENSWALPRLQSGSSVLNLDGSGSWSYSYDNGAPLVDVCALDSGVQKNHTEFASIQSQIKSLSYADGYGGVFGGGTTFAPSDGHGTAVCSIIVGPSVGVAKQATYWGMNIGAPGSGGFADAYNAVYVFHRTKTDRTRPTIFIIEFCTVGNEDDRHLFQDMTDRLAYSGVIVIYACGNGGFDGQGGFDSSNPQDIDAPDFFWNLIPGNLRNSILVGGITTADEMIYNYGDRVDFFSSASGTRAAQFNGTYYLFGGTSGAMAVVAGACARFMNDNLTANIFELKILMQASGAFKTIHHINENVYGSRRSCILQAPSTIPIMARPSGL